MKGVRQVTHLYFPSVDNCLITFTRLNSEDQLFARPIPPDTGLPNNSPADPHGPPPKRPSLVSHWKQSQYDLSTHPGTKWGRGKKALAGSQGCGWGGRGHAKDRIPQLEIHVNNDDSERPDPASPPPPEAPFPASLTSSPRTRLGIQRNHRVSALWEFV